MFYGVDVNNIMKIKGNDHYGVSVALAQGGTV